MNSDGSDTNTTNTQAQPLGGQAGTPTASVVERAGPEITVEDLKLATRRSDIRGLTSSRLAALKVGAHKILAKRVPSDIRNDQVLDYILILDEERLRRATK